MQIWRQQDKRIPHNRMWYAKEVEALVAVVSMVGCQFYINVCSPTVGTWQVHLWDPCLHTPTQLVHSSCESLVWQ